MGSVHALTPDFYPLYEEFDQAFEEADTLVVEVNILTIPERDVSIKFQQIGTYKSGTLRENLSPETLDLLIEYLDDTDQQLNTYNSLRPWFVSLQIGMQLLGVAGYDPALGIDQHYLRKAESTKEILELESFDEQMHMLSSDPPEIQDLSLRASLHEVDRTSSDLARLVSAWQQGNVEEIYRIATRSVRGYPELEVQLHRLIDARNPGMVDKIRQYLERPGTYLVIVGALHLGGKNGIINLLRQDFEVTQQQRNLVP
jgi:uncharacterized protein YbaP (TraB family)